MFHSRPDDMCTRIIDAPRFEVVMSLMWSALSFEGTGKKISDYRTFPPYNILTL